MEQATAQAPANAAPKPVNHFDIPPVDLNITEHNIGICLVTGEDEAGNERTQTFFHRIAKQERGDVISLLSATAVERASKAAGTRQKLDYGNSDALRRYWSKYHAGVKGYPDADDWRTVPDELREDWHPSHQVMAVNALLEAEAKIAGSELTFDGGIWTVLVGVPNLARPVALLKFQVNEWGQRQASAIEHKGYSRYQTIGGGQETGLNAALYIETLLELTRRVDGCTVDGALWDEYVKDEASKARLLKMIYPAWVYTAALVLFARWQAQKRD